MDTLDGFNHQLQDDALSKILSNVMTRDRTAKVTADLSNILSPQKVSFLDENEKLERKWVSPSKKKHVDIDTDNLKAMIHKAQQHFATIEILQQHLKRASTTRIHTMKSFSYPTTATANKAHPRANSESIDEATFQSELWRAFQTLKNLHARLKEATSSLEAREACVQDAERVLSTARSAELLHFAATIPAIRERLSARSDELSSFEDALREERDLLIRSVAELRDIRAQVCTYLYIPPRYVDTVAHATIDKGFTSCCSRRRERELTLGTVCPGGSQGRPRPARRRRL
jgi:hypothetical protein